MRAPIVPLGTGEDMPKGIDDDAVDYSTCHHGIYKGNAGGVCDACDAFEEERGGLDMCLCCGRYQWGKDLNADQCCIKGCTNPNEY